MQTKKPHDVIRKATMVAALTALAGLAACGGGGGGGDDLSPTKISGTVVDGPIRGATVFLDLNANFVQDAGEPASLPSASDGGFEIVADNLGQAQLATALLVTHIPPTAFDADDGGRSIAAAGRQAFTLATPASAYLQVSNGEVTAAAPALLSPFTTLVAAEMSINGLSIAAAKAKVQKDAELGAKDPMTNFVAAGDKGMGTTARVIAIALGELGKQISSAAQTSSGSQRQFVAATLAELHTQLPSLLSNVDTSGATNAPVPVTSITSNLAANR
jgi:hypothetical protein